MIYQKREGTNTSHAVDLQAQSDFACLIVTKANDRKDIAEKN